MNISNGSLSSYPKANISSYSKVGNIQQKKGDNGGVSFTQKVQFGEKTYHISVHYAEAHVDKDVAERELDTLIEKMLILAKNLKLGNKELQTIRIDEKGVNYGLEGKTFENFMEGLNEKAEKANSPEEANKIKEKIKSINDCISFISNHFRGNENRSVSLNSSFPVENLNAINSNIIIKEHLADVDIPRIPIENLIFNSFDKHLTDAKNYAANIETAENEKNRTLLNTWKAAYESINEGTLEEIEGLKSTLNTVSTATKEQTTANQQQSFEALENSLAQMAQEYNKLIEVRRDYEGMNQLGAHTENINKFKSLEAQMRSEITSMNALLGNARLSTNPETATTSNVMGIGAVVEKKLTLLGRKAELESKGPNLTKKDKKELKKITSDLKKAPSTDAIRTLSEKTEKELKSPNKTLLTGKDAKALNEVPPELKWGNSHIALTLTTPANWTPMRTAVIKQSKAGMMHVSVEILEPINIGENGGVSSGLRNKEPYNKRVTNFIKTTSYLKQADGTEAGKKISYRGGQFPTPEAAKEAINTIIDDNGGEVPENLHINTLLTPTTNPILKLFRKDSKLLPEHKQSIETALDTLIDEVLGKLNAEKNKPAEDQDTDEISKLNKNHEKLVNLKSAIAISNFGVNQDAMGEIRFKLMGIGSLFRLKFGWHTSIRDYSNTAVEKLSTALDNKISSIEWSLTEDNLFGIKGKPLLDDLDHLGAIFSLGGEMETIWATNDYAEGRGSNNPFKFPSLWKVMDGLIGIITYSDCMSGKDRTGWVESTAKDYADEIEMNILDQKRALLSKFDAISEKLEGNEKKEWDSHQQLLTTACFTIEDLDQLAKALNRSEDIKDAIEKMLEAKVKVVRELTEDGLIKPKEGMHGKTVGRFSYNTSGIPKTEPRIHTLQNDVKKLPKLAASSLYGRPSIDVVNPEETDVAVLENRQREAVNRRLSQLGGSLQVIQRNTSKAGNKEKKGEPLARMTSGFDRDYVLYKLFNKDEQISNFSQWVGLHELDADSAARFSEEATAINSDLKLDDHKKMKAYNSLLREIEKAKMQGLSAQGKVKA